MAKAVFKDLSKASPVLELDQRDERPDIQDALNEIVVRHTVPQAFLDGKLIGGSDDTVEAYGSEKTGQLCLVSHQ